jgi:WD40 repeat protein
MTVFANPFLALAPFKSENHDILFGRDGDLTLMVDRLVSRRATLLFAGSGVGKTSFLDAKLAPELKGRYFICSHSRWAADEPLRAVAASLANALKESGWGSENAAAPQPAEDAAFSLLKFYSRPDLFPRAQPSGSILILDQFEEVFQYHKDAGYFALFIDQLSELINAPAPEVRVLFSMREEFLGELSVFDNRISDLFNNYYRLKNPNKRQARDIIAATVRSVGVKPSESLSVLVDDLLSVTPSRNILSQDASGMTAAARSLRDYVSPPYLQIACYRLWQRTATAQEGGSPTFPASYQKGDATRELELYCRENLDSLPSDQQNLVCDALGFLMTKQGAKMAYELSNLADHMGAPRDTLRGALEQLSRPNVRILRQFSAPDGSLWFELYHDMFAPFLSAWKVAFQQAREKQRQAEEQEKDRQREEERTRRAEAERQVAEEKRQRDEAERALLRNAQALAEEQRQRAEEKARRAKWLMILAASLAVALLLAVVGSVHAIHYRSKLARSRELAARALTTLNVDPELGVLLSLQALGTSPALEAEDALHQSLESLQVSLTLAIPSSNDPIRTVAYSPDGARLATAGDDRKARIWDAASGQLLLTLSGHGDRIWGVAFSLDGKRLATASLDNTAKVWDATTGKELRTLSGHRNMVLGIAFSPDGKQIATASADKTAKVWDAVSGKELRTLSGRSGTVYGVAFSPDGKRLATASADKTAKVWDAESGELLRTLSGHTDSVQGIAFRGDGKLLVTASADGTARVWDANATLGGPALVTLSGQTRVTQSTQTSAVTSVAFESSGNRVATASLDGTVKIWNSSSGQLLRTLSGHAGGVSAVAFDRYGEHVATAGMDGTAKVWNINSSGGEVFSAVHSTFPLTAIAFSPEGARIATASDDNTAKIWTGSGTELHMLVGHLDTVYDVAFSPDGRVAATASSDKTVKLWDATSGKILRALPETTPETTKFTCIAFSPDGKTVAAGGEDGTVRLWDEPFDRAPLILPGHRGKVSKVAFSPNGKRFATASWDRTAKVWDADSGKESLTLGGSHTDAVLGVSFSPDGKRVATASRDGTAKLWDAESGRDLRTFSGHTNAVTSVAFTPDGKRLVTSSWDGTVRLWDASSGVMQLGLIVPGSPILRVAVSPDGRRLGTASLDGVLRVNAMNLEDVAALAAKAITRPFTDQECRKYLRASKNCSETTAPALQLAAEGASLARVGDLGAATEKLRDAQKKNHALVFDPEREAKQLRASVLIMKGRNLGLNGDEAGARESLRSALALDPSLKFDPDEEARSLSAQGRVNDGELLVRRGKVKEAIAAYAEAQRVDPARVLDASSLNTLCWFGALWGYAREVMYACNEASQLDPDDWNIGDSLGVAMVLTGHPTEAIPYFEKFVESAVDQKQKQRRQTWITALRHGRNPLTLAEREWLFVNY